MPTVSFLFKDFQQLLGKKMPIEEFESMLLLYVKAELGKHDKETGEVTVELDDTNLPYLWCPEGIARLLRGILGLQKGAAKLKVTRGSYKLIVESSVKSIRPYITAFVAKGKKLDDYLLKQLVQMQEKFCESYGRRRQKTSIGLYSYKRIKFPVHYKAVAPESAKFVPLDSDKVMNLNEILLKHPKGQQYGWILANSQKYPLLVDDGGQILSFPPIINSNYTGKLEVGDGELFFEATGTDEETVNLAANIFAQNLAERGFEIFSATMAYDGRTTVIPSAAREKVKINPTFIEQLTGLRLSAAELKLLLEKTGYDVMGGYAVVPHYRADILHPVDMAEDVAVAYGFDKIKDEPLKSYTTGAKDKAIEPINQLRKSAIGIGFQEIFSHILTDKNTLITGMGNGGNDAILEIKNIMSETYSAVRNSLIPQLLDVISKNKHEDYPQKIFEEGIVAAREGGKIAEVHSLALVSAHSKADFTEQKQYVSAILGALGIAFTIQQCEHPAFLKGRAGSIVINGKPAGILGEISPALLSKWGIEMPATAAEINVTLLIGIPERVYGIS